MMSVTPSHIIEYLFCPRFTWFEYVLAIPQYEEKNYKVMQGRNLHDRKLEENKGYFRRRVGAVGKHLDQYLTNGLLRGRVDEVLELEDGSMAPLDYKFAKYEEKLYHTYKIQLACYALLIIHNFEKSVNRGFLVYTRSKNKLLEVPITAKELEEVEEASRSIAKIIGENFYPKATKYKAKCVNCHYKNICTK
jgi:CRISPR-associated exonuclease Cas4